MDRKRPVALITPCEREPSLEVRKATRRLADVELPPPLDPPIDSLAALLADRARR